MELETTMTIDTPIVKPGLGERLKAAREAMHLTEKEAASRLRLNAKIIPMLENENLDQSLPPTFIRGYLRSYARLLNISEAEINAAINTVETPIPEIPRLNNASPLMITQSTQRSQNYLRWMTYVVAAVLATLVCLWWTSHPKDSAVKPVATTEPAATAPAAPTEATTATAPAAAVAAPTPVAATPAPAAAPAKATGTATDPTDGMALSDPSLQESNE